MKHLALAIFAACGSSGWVLMAGNGDVPIIVGVIGCACCVAGMIQYLVRWWENINESQA
jgi:hypothetical protein